MAAPPPGETPNLGDEYLALVKAGETPVLELDDEAEFGLRLASPVEHCEDLLPHGEHEWLDGVRRAQCPGVPEPEPALEPSPEPEKKYDPLKNTVLGGDALRANIIAAHSRTPEPEPEQEPVAPPTVQLPPALGMTDPATAHTRVELVEPAPLFAEGDLA